MKRSEPSPETLRSSAQLRDRQPGDPPPRPSEEPPRGAEEFRPRHLDLPPRRTHGGGFRNIMLGMLLVFGAALLLSYAAYLAGPRAILPVGVALLTATTLYALARLRLFRQRNGGFVAVGLVCLLGVVVPLLEHAWTRGERDSMAQDEEGQEDAAGTSRSAADAKGEPRSLKEAFKLSTPEPDAFGFRVLQDLRVEIEGKRYVINEGDIFAVGDMTGEDVRFTAGEEQIALPLNMVELIGSPEKPGPAPSTATAPPPAANPATVASTPPKSGPVNITEEAQREAIRRYPAIGVKNSPENLLFVDSYQELKHSGADDFFANPEWPLALADMIAKREKWNQPGQSSQPQPGADAALQEESRPKRRPVAEELDDMEEGAGTAPAAPSSGGASPAMDPEAELPAQ